MVLREESYRVIGACFEVYNTMGSGFLEAVYHECLEREFTVRGISFSSRTLLRLEYKGESLQQSYIPDFICFGKVLMEIKAHKCLLDEHRAQTINYLKATGLQLALLVNFSNPLKLEHERFINLPNNPCNP